MYWEVEITPEEEEELIRKIAEKVHNYGMDTPTILFLHSIKPLSYVGSQMGRFILSPFLLFFGEEIGLTGEKLFQMLAKRENVEKIIEKIEELTRDENTLEKSN